MQSQSQGEQQWYSLQEGDSEDDYYSFSSQQESPKPKPKPRMKLNKKKTKIARRRKLSISAKILRIWTLMRIETFFPEFPYDLFEKLVLHKPIFGLPGREFEFLGDRILKTIHGWLAFEVGENKSTLVSILESNRVFACYLQKMGGICTLLNLSIESKRCADFFETIVGALFYFHFSKDYDYNILKRIEEWISEVTIYSEHVSELLNMDLKHYDPKLDPIFKNRCQSTHIAL
jgi:hypothetical protein